MKKKVWLKRVALTAALGFLLFAFGWVPYFLAGMGTTRRFQFPDRENGGLTPATFQLASEDVAFRSADGVDLRGWWVPAPSAKGTVVLVHGLNRSRIEMVRRAPFVHSAGWNALLFDLRHHGASGGETTTFGAKEKEDVEAAVRLARERAPGPAAACRSNAISFGIRRSSELATNRTGLPARRTAAVRTSAAAGSNPPRRPIQKRVRSASGQRGTIRSHHLNPRKSCRWCRTVSSSER